MTLDPLLAQRLDDIVKRLDHQHELSHNLIERQADEKALILDLQERIIEMTAVADRITASVANLTTVEQSAVALLGQLSQLIRDNATDPAALNALADSIDTDATELAGAVTANTPAATTPVEPPVTPTP